MSRLVSIPPRALLLHNARVIDPEAGTETHGGVLVEDRRIRDIGPHLAPGRFTRDALMRDCGGAVVAPGLVDMRVSMGEPGMEARETLRSMGEAAVAGGVTTVLAMPNTDPPVDDAAVVDFLLRRARDTAKARVLPAGALTKGVAGQEMTEIGLMRESGAAAFTDGLAPIANPLVLRRALTYARHFGALVINHVEDRQLAGAGVMNEGEFALRLGLPGIPQAAETIMLERDLRLAALTGGRYHAAMLSCAESVRIAAGARRAGLDATFGVSINSLTLNETDVGPYRTFFKLSPPLREEAEREALVEGLAEGVIDVIVSDHDPQDVETKRLPFAEAAPGAIGLETMLAAALRLHHAGRIGLPRLLAAMTCNPAKRLGLPQGVMRKGAPADLVVFDPDEPWLVDPARMRSQSKNTPFEGARMTGRAHLTVVGGEIVFDLAAEADR